MLLERIRLNLDFSKLSLSVQALGFEKRQPDIDGIVKILMSRLEKDKVKLQLSDTDEQHCETFAQLIFNRAEKMDQAGRWDQNTVIAYYSASYFIEVRLHPDSLLDFTWRDIVGLHVCQAIIACVLYLEVPLKLLDVLAR